MAYNTPKGPNLFSVGAPKCGTTSMYEYLRKHPQIFFPFDEADPARSKEPNYFCPELEIGEKVSIKDKSKYLSLYRDSDGAKWRGDASVMYLFSEQAAGRIKQFCPDARILIMLRPPLEQMHSRHAHCLLHHAAKEDIADFYEAVEAGDDRRKGLRIPPQSLIPRCLDYFSVARFAPQVERYFHVFGRESVHVVLLEDLFAQPVETYLGVLKFLDVDTTFLPEFRAYNTAPLPGKLGHFLHAAHSQPGIRQVADFLVPYQLRRRVALAVQRRYRGESEADPCEAELRERCKPDIERLARLIDRDLSHWL